MARQIKDMAGLMFGRLTVIKLCLEKDNPSRSWECLCECGKNIIVDGSNLRRGYTKSCGCFRVENAKRTIIENTNGIKHGMVNSSEYNSWQSMKKRCYIKSNPDYSNYGGRGVVVCERWINSFENFYQDMGPKPTSLHSLDKDIKAKELGVPAMVYSPEMCVWATQKEQQNNRRNTHIVEYKGEKHTISKWAEIVGKKRATIWTRIFKHKWSVEDALTY